MKWLVGLLLVIMSATPAMAGPVTVRDGLGREVVLTHPPVRIISLTPSVTEILYALHLQDRVIAVTTSDHYPPEVASKPAFDGIHPDFERIVELHPDLVILEGRLAPASLEQLDRLHLAALALDSATLSGYHESVRLVGRVTDTVPQADALLHDLDRRMLAISRRVQAVPEDQRPHVFVEIWDRPLQTAAAGTFVDELIRRAGGLNCFSDLSGFPQVSAEQLLVRRPQVVLLTTSSVEAFESRPGVSGLPAVRDHRVYPVQPPDRIVRPSPRLADGLEALYRLLYPK